MADRRDGDVVGYKRPPARTRFKRGQSGNPKGRPKHVANLRTDLHDELNEVIRVREGDRELRISKQRAFIKALVAAAIKGDMRAGSALVSLYTRALGVESDDGASKPAAADDLEILEAFVGRELKRRTADSGASDVSAVQSPHKGERNAA